ncbi:MAG: DUF4872 domain-containing protein [Acidobacteria bacterium]|nr:DUF4872 domain-containing protein [Acidobacteriota bacterium]
MATGVRSKKKIKAPPPPAPKLGVPGYRHSGGRHHETAHLRNILDHLGLKAPHTGAPYSEEMLLGIGGGIGCGYFLFETGGSTFVSVGTRHLWQSTKADFIQGICGRLGCRVTTKEASGHRAAEENLHEALLGGRPAVVWLGQASLPWHGLPIEWLKLHVYCIVVYGFDEKAGRYLVADRSRKPFTIDAKELAAARPAVISLRSRTLFVEPPNRAPDLAHAIRDGLQACVQGMIKPGSANFGLSALQKWADLLTNAKDVKGWPRALPPGTALLDALMSCYGGIETQGTGGGAFRSMYAAFLDEARGVLSLPALGDVAAGFRESAAAWTGLAGASLPEYVPLLVEARGLMGLKARLFEEGGDDSVPGILEVEGKLAALRDQAAIAFPLSAAQALDLLAGMRKKVERIHEIETGAIEALRLAIA